MTQRRRVRFPYVRLCGDGSMVESEDANLGMGVRFPLTALDFHVMFVLVLLEARQLDSQSGDAGSNPAEDAEWFGPSWAICLRTHLVKRSDCRSDEGSSILLGGAHFYEFFRAH